MWPSLSAIGCGVRTLSPGSNPVRPFYKFIKFIRTRLSRNRHASHGTYGSCSFAFRRSCRHNDVYSRTTGPTTVVVGTSRLVANISAKLPLFGVNAVVLEANEKPTHVAAVAIGVRSIRDENKGDGEIAGSYGNCGVGRRGWVSDGQNN